METKNLLLLFLFITLIPQLSYSQAPSGSGQPEKELSLDSGTIEDQFDYITTKSNSFQEYKVVKKTWLAKIESNISDSLNKMKNDLTGMRSGARLHKREMDSLHTAMETANADLQVAKTTKNSIDLLGIQTGKASYNSIMWGLVLVLGGALVFFIFKSKRASLITSDAVKTLQETKEELDTHRKKALEREQKLNRRLQDELNKQLR